LVLASDANLYLRKNAKCGDLGFRNIKKYSFNIMIKEIIILLTKA